jgi:peroxiredoxin
LAQSGGREVSIAKILEPGIKAPHFRLPAANSENEISFESDSGKKAVLLFFPYYPEAGIFDQLGNFQERFPDFEEQGATVIGISNAGGMQLGALAQDKQVLFPILSCSGSSGEATARAYGVLSDQGQVLPTVFIIDEDGLIRRVYDSVKYSGLPNPAMVLRALKKLADVPKAPPIFMDDWQLGPPDAPVTVIEYADYQCGPCREAYRLLKEIIPGYGDKILWVHRHLPLRHSHPLAQQAAEAAEAAGAQGMFWEMHDRLFEADGALERDHLITYAREFGLDIERFITDLDHHVHKDLVNADFKAAVRSKIKLPPALFINYLPLEGPRTKEAICGKIDRLLVHTLQR